MSKSIFFLSIPFKSIKNFLLSTREGGKQRSTLHQSFQKALYCKLFRCSNKSIFAFQWWDNKSKIYCGKWIKKKEKELAKSKQKAACLATFCVNQNLKTRLKDQYLASRWNIAKFPLTTKKIWIKRNIGCVNRKEANAKIHIVFWLSVIKWPHWSLTNYSIFMHISEFNLIVSYGGKDHLSVF